MNKIVTIGGKEIGVSINALTPKLYHETFHKNFFDEVQNITTDITALKEITYIMARRYEAKSPRKMELSVEDFENWLEQFGMFDFELSGTDIVNLIGEQSKPTVVPKG